VSLTSVPGKMIESVIKNKITQYMNYIFCWEIVGMASARETYLSNLLEF